MELRQPYEAQLSEFRLTYSKAGSITSAVLVLGGVGLDYFTYPERLLEFFLLRLAVVVPTLIVFVLLYTEFGREKVRSLTMVWLVFPQAMIAWMIFQTEGVQSIYFVGLHLAMYAVGIILPISLAEGIGFGLVTLILYVLACVFHSSGIGDGARLYTNSLFVMFSAVARLMTSSSK